jgi:hypothetical protein
LSEGITEKGGSSLHRIDWLEKSKVKGPLKILRSVTTEETHPKALDDPGLLMEGTAWGKEGKTSAFCLYITCSRNVSQRREPVLKFIPA